MERSSKPGGRRLNNLPGGRVLLRLHHSYHFAVTVDDLNTRFRVARPVGWLAGGIAVALGPLLFAGTVAAAQALPRVVIQTTVGSIEVEVDTVRAPITGSNFLRYVDQGAYRNGRFHRTVRSDNQADSKVKIEVIQGGLDPGHFKPFSPIELERTTKTGLSHKDGTISMARDGPDTATSDFFISIGDQPELDFGGKRNPDGQGFAAFGRVVRGMDVVRQIQTARAQGQRLTPAIEIQDIIRAGKK
jgi:peptidyl-prolyl cis-trans isomerase A (cyclophilin A)